MGPSEQALVIELDNSDEYQKLLDGQPQTRGTRSGRVHLATGKTCGQHSTKEHEEILVFLSGRGTLIISEKDRFTVGKGKIAYIPPNTLHDVQNTGTEPLIYIYCVAPVR